MGFSIELLNTIRANASTEYQNRVPEATRENFTTIGMILDSWDIVKNEYLDSLFNKIGKTTLESKLFKNKLARFKSGEILTQQDVEEIFVEMGKAPEAYDPDGKTALARRTPADVKVVYHRMNRRDCYATSLGDIDFVRVFRSEATHDAFVTAQINAIYSRANHDEWVQMKNVLASFDGYFDYGVPAISNGTAEAGAKAFVKTLRKAVQDVSFASDKFNKAGVMTWCDPSDLVLFVNKDVLAEVDVEVLAKAFNLGKTDIQTMVVPMDDFGSLSDTYGLLVDKDFFRVYDTLSRMEPQRNAQGLFTNYFYHVHQILSASPFKTAIRFTTATVSE